MDREWYVLADGSFGFESMLVKQSAVAAADCAFYNSRLPTTKFIVRSFS
jgi:hypothetical protein